MSSKPITIIGAGISGLTLGRCLLKRGIPAVLYEKAPLRPRNIYSITLHAHSYQPLLEVLGIDETTFKHRVAADGASGEINQKVIASYGPVKESSIRVHRGKLEELLREGLTVKWEHALEKVEHGSDRQTKLHFANGSSVESTFVIAADGVHSTLRRTLLPDVEAKVLPFVAFNGRRKIDKATFDEIYAPYLNGSTVICHKHKDTLLTISMTEKSEEQISITWIFSRRPRGDTDALYKPNRPQAGATDTPEEFFQEITSLINLEPPFRDVFNVEKLRKERILHWLMRTVSADLAGIEGLAKDGIVFLGDSVHAEPILGGDGANKAIEDGIGLAQAIASGGETSIVDWYRQNHEHWVEGVQVSEKRIEEMHSS